LLSHPSSHLADARLAKAKRSVCGFGDTLGTRLLFVSGATVAKSPRLLGFCEGDDRNRTGVNGFAGRCVATPPRRQVGIPGYRPVDTLGSCPGRLAQLGERRLDKAEVTGSSPVSPITGKCRRGRTPLLRTSARARRACLPVLCPLAEQQQTAGLDWIELWSRERRWGFVPTKGGEKTHKHARLPQNGSPA
jgi:hypothetical protein